MKVTDATDDPTHCSATAGIGDKQICDGNPLGPVFPQQINLPLI